jgi:tRNA modification GTPase
VVPEILIKSLLSAGARQALPGEFTRRAVLNGKMDLIQAEAVGDLIDASSDPMRRVVLHQLDGGLSKQIENLREELLQIEALLVYDIDFPDEDDGPISRNRVTDTAVRVCDLLELLLETAPATELVRDGAIIVIAGRPNVGKSSLFNALIGEVRAIVTEFPGTTRDAIEARLQFGQWPVRLIDTAGLHSTQQIIERLGIEISERYIANAHVVLVCDDELDKLAATTTLVNQLSPAPVLQILTKCDQHASTGADRDLLRVDQRGIIGVSAQKRVGLNSLTDRVGFLLEERYGAIPIARPALTRTRQRIVVQRARDELDEFTTRWREGALPATIAAVHIRQAVGALDELIGAVDVDEILGRVFATFCVGK